MALFMYQKLTPWACCTCWEMLWSVCLSVSLHICHLLYGWFSYNGRAYGGIWRVAARSFSCQDCLQQCCIMSSKSCSCISSMGLGRSLWVFCSFSCISSTALQCDVVIGVDVSHFVFISGYKLEYILRRCINLFQLPGDLGFYFFNNPTNGLQLQKPNTQELAHYAPILQEEPIGNCPFLSLVLRKFFTVNHDSRFEILQLIGFLFWCPVPFSMLRPYS